MIESPDGTRPPLDERGLPTHGATWGPPGHVVLRAVSRGPGIPVEVTHPRNPGAPPRRVISGDGRAALSAGKLLVTPTTAPAGEHFALVVEM